MNGVKYRLIVTTRGRCVAYVATFIVQWADTFSCRRRDAGHRDVSSAHRGSSKAMALVVRWVGDEMYDVCQASFVFETL
jgi:hypothetical protein